MNSEINETVEVLIELSKSLVKGYISESDLVLFKECLNQGLSLDQAQSQVILENSF
jgi:hypothetical protein